MATSAVDICNGALCKIGVTDYISALDDPGKEAATANLLYAKQRDTLLSTFPWSFAARRVELALVGAEEGTRDGWLYVYGMPSDCLAPRMVWQKPTSGIVCASSRSMREDQKWPFDVEKSAVGDGKVLLSDADNAVLLYTCVVEDVSKFSPLFVEALEFSLAAEMALPLTGKASLEERMRSRYLLRFGEACAADMRGKQEDPPAESEFIAVRR